MIRLSSKCIFCGDGNVGKTSLRRRFIGKDFNVKYFQTLGADFTSKIIELEKDNQEYQIKMVIWDIAGQESFESVRSRYYQGASGILLVFDLLNFESFENVKNWVKEIQKNIRLPPLVLIGNKVDLIAEGAEQKYVTEKEAKELANFISEKFYNKKYQVPFLQTSAKTGQNVEKAFLLLSSAIVNEYWKQKRELRKY